MVLLYSKFQMEEFMQGVSDVQMAIIGCTGDLDFHTPKDPIVPSGKLNSFMFQ